jgi:hypothetical protein
MFRLFDGMPKLTLNDVISAAIRAFQAGDLPRGEENGT